MNSRYYTIMRNAYYDRRPMRAVSLLLIFLACATLTAAALIGLAMVVLVGGR